MKKIIVGLLLALLSGLLVVSAPPASAAGGCTIYVPRYVYVDAPYERIEGRLGANCASSGMDWSAWDIMAVSTQTGSTVTAYFGSSPSGVLG